MRFPTLKNPILRFRKRNGIFWVLKKSFTNTFYVLWILKLIWESKCVMTNRLNKPTQPPAERKREKIRPQKTKKLAKIEKNRKIGSGRFLVYFLSILANWAIGQFLVNLSCISDFWAEKWFLGPKIYFRKIGLFRPTWPI